MEWIAYFEKAGDGLLPAIVQDHISRKVLMLGYMNAEAFKRTLETGKVTFFSRKRQELWTKGETSGNYLELRSWAWDCDQDTLLIKAEPIGPTCHTGSDTCWNETNSRGLFFLEELQDIIEQRKEEGNPEESYVSRLFAKGINKIAQKVGEEAVETVIEAKDDNPELLLGEAADLLFHLAILLSAKGYRLEDVVGVLEKRHRKKS